MRQTNLFEFLGELEEALKQEAFKEAQELDQAEDVVEKKMTPIEEVITTFIKGCITSKRLPTLQEAQTIHVLDEINSKYNKA